MAVLLWLLMSVLYLYMVNQLCVLVQKLMNSELIITVYPDMLGTRELLCISVLFYSRLAIHSNHIIMSLYMSVVKKLHHEKCISYTIYGKQVCIQLAIVTAWLDM